MFALRVPSRTFPRNSAYIRYLSTGKSYVNIVVSQPEAGVALFTLNRPKALNALNSALMRELNEAMAEADEDKEIKAMVVTGSEKAFAAGADIKEMKDKTFSGTYGTDFLGDWTRITKLRKPVIAAVSGYALGGGCELAMMCDIILASPTANFGQPEINLGVIPGAGGSQRLTRAIGKSRAMEAILTGSGITAQQASEWGLVSRVVPEGEGEVVREAIKVAKKISLKGAVSVQAGKEMVNAAFESSLAEGVRLERRIFHSLFATKDQKEGMGAFAEKRKPNFSDE